MTEGVRAICFPHDDDGFCMRVQQLVQGSSSEQSPLYAAVEVMLRETYPLAVISPRQAMASADGRRIWYVYRDGAYVAHPEADAPVEGGSP